MLTWWKKYSGFTIVELLIVIVVIGILAAITTVAYAGIISQAGTVALKADLETANKQLNLKQVQNGSYPSPTLPGDIKPSSGNSFEYTSNGTTFCLTGTSSRAGVGTYNVSNSTGIAEGACAGHSDGGSSVADGSYIQTITDANCPTTRTRAVDARDSHTYWVQKLDDGKCWMLTNLAYAGGGTNTYGDVRALANGTGLSASLTDAYYYVVPSTTNYTTEPTAPSTSTNGIGQYGYLYNWCGAMGGQATAACASATTPTPTASTSCPAGWRLPTGNGGEVGALNNAINNGSVTINSGLLATWLAQYSSYWQPGWGFSQQGSYSEYWTGTMMSATDTYLIEFAANTVNPSVHYGKEYGFAVRCVAV